MTIPVTTAAEMREMDRIAIEDLGIPGVVLMEVAGRAVAREVARLAGDLEPWRVAVLAGAGNNGGDGYVVARHLAEWGARVTLYLFGPEERIRGDARVYFDVARRLGVPMVSWEAGELPEDLVGFFSEHHCVVDALLGTGLDKEVRGHYRQVIEAVNAARALTRANTARALTRANTARALTRANTARALTRANASGALGRANASGALGRASAGPTDTWAGGSRAHEAPLLTVAVDIPSGLCADTGHPLGAAIHADVTVTFACPKIGLVTHPGVQHTGELRIADIGIPASLASQVGVRCSLLVDEDVAALVPVRHLGGHKGTYGHLLVVAGSPGKTGAAVLAARGAARVGAGLVTVAVTGDALFAVAAQSLETMCAVYSPLADRIQPQEAAATLIELARGKSAVVVGPGIPTTDAMVEVLRELVSYLQVPLVLDADGLNLLARRHLPLSQATMPVLLTPHPGEMARLLGISVAEVQGDRLRAAREAASGLDAFVALKGARTVIAAPSGEAFISPTGNPGMGSGGTGDVLAGMVGGFLAQGVAPLDSLQLGVFLHGLAGDHAAARKGEHSLLAGDLLEEIPMVMQSRSAQNRPL